MFQRILIIKPSSLGDIIHALPALSALRARFPDSWIGWVVKREWADLLMGHPDLNEVVAVDFQLSQWPSLVKRIRSLACDLAIDLQGLFRSGVLARLSGARERVGFAAGREGSPLFYTQRVELPNPQQKPWRLMDMHAVDRNLRIAHHLGADISQPRFVLPLCSDQDKEVADWFACGERKPNERWVGMAPLSRQAIKNWPLERFLHVAAELIGRLSCRIVLLGAPSQRWMVSRFLEVLGENVLDCVGKTTLRHLPSVLKRLDLLIANDSAVLHVAAAVGTPTLALFGPTNPLATGPYGALEPDVLTVSLPCRPCGQGTCHNTAPMACLQGLSVEVVGERAIHILEQSPQKSIGFV